MSYDGYLISVCGSYTCVVRYQKKMFVKKSFSSRAACECKEKRLFSPDIFKSPSRVSSFFLFSLSRCEQDSWRPPTWRALEADRFGAKPRPLPLLHIIFPKLLFLLLIINIALAMGAPQSFCVLSRKWKDGESGQDGVVMKFGGTNLIVRDLWRFPNNNGETFKNKKAWNSE